MSNNPNSNVNVSDRSDVLSILNTIKDTYRISQNTINIYTRNSLLWAISTEAEMLCLKLDVMYKRWQIHLPFKEACGVDFFDWARTITDMVHQLSNSNEASDAKADPYCPSKHFLLDLYCILQERDAKGVHQKEAAPYYEETNILKLLRQQDRMRTAMTNKWKEYRRLLSEKTLESVTSRLHSDKQQLRNEDDGVQTICIEVLTDLASKLTVLSNMSTRVITAEEYIRLVERITNEPEYEGHKALYSAKQYYYKWKNGTPINRISEEREYEIGIAEQAIKDLKYGRLLSKYIQIHDSLENQKMQLGQFLNQYRDKISIDELRLLLEYVFRLNFFLEDERKDLAATQSEQSPSIASPQSATDPAPRTDIPLPPFFVHDLRVHTEASSLFLTTFARVGRYIGRVLTKEIKERPDVKPYVKWKWNHLLKVFQEQGLILPDTTQSDFANFVVQVLPDRKPGNVLQSIYRNCNKKDPSILADIRDEFRPITTLLSATS